MSGLPDSSSVWELDARSFAFGPDADPETAGKLAFALGYAAAGIPVFPLHTPNADGRCSCRRDCGRDNGKHPRTLHGLNDATTNPDRIAYWWGVWPEANIALATGGLFWVLDVDAGKGEASLARLEDEHGTLPPTWSVVTGSGGLHLWFRFRTEYAFRNSESEVGAGLDVKTRRGYVVAPPSLHRSGNRYAWSECWRPGAVPLADAPDWLIRLVGQRSERRARAWRLAADGEPITEGQRNGVLTSMAGVMRHVGFSAPAILAALATENQSRCRPPLDDDEVQKIAASIARYPVATINLSSNVTAWRGLRARETGCA